MMNIISEIRPGVGFTISNFLKYEILQDVFLFIYIYMYVCIYKYIYICIYIYVYTYHKAAIGVKYKIVDLV